MKHPFEVGGKYRNRHGEYEVINLEGPKMVIRYSNGNSLETTVELQARIWWNIQAEQNMKSPTHKPGPRPPRRQRGLKFQCLQDRDFQKGVAGTSWRARTSLGGLLAQRMSDTTQYFFQSHAIYRRAEVHIVQPTHYDTKTKLRKAKFVLELDSECARYGFYIEKNDGPMDDTWHWLDFLASLDSDPELCRTVETTMRKLGLRWEICVWDEGGLMAQMGASPDGLIWKQKDRDEPEEVSWSGFVKRLRDIETEKWCDLYLCADIAKDEAIAAGIHLVDTVTEVYRALLPLYEASTR